MKRLADLVVDDDAPAPSEPALPFRTSSLAKPPITLEEVRTAETATCRLHHGHISHTRVTSDAWDKVYFCPIGRQYWRYSKRLSELLRPLRYPDAP